MYFYILNLHEMIQRIQSVYLFLVIVLSVAFMTGTIYSFTGQSGQLFNVNFYGTRVSDGSLPQVFNLLSAALALLVPALSLVSIFLFRNRKLQSLLVVIAALLSLSLSVLILVKGMGLAGESTVKNAFAFRAVLPFINLILLLLALRGIKKDEELVRSYDRLR